MKRLKWGILSTAQINGAYMPVLQNSSQHELLAVASRDQERSRKYSEKWNIPVAYGSYEELLKDDRIDCVYISLPNHLHAEWSIRSVFANKHVLCEKPLALSESDVNKMIVACRDTKKRIMEAFMYRNHPQISKVLNLIKEGKIGQLDRISAGFTHVLELPGNYRWNRDQGGGSLWDLGCYAVHFSRMISGEEPMEVIGRQKTHPSGVDESFFGMLMFPGGLISQIDCGFNSAFNKRAEIIGAKGSILIENPWHSTGVSSITLSNMTGEERIHYQTVNSFALQVDEFSKLISDGGSPDETLRDSLGNVRAIAALLESASASGKAVPSP